MIDTHPPKFKFTRRILIYYCLPLGIQTNQPTGHHFNLTGHQTSDMTCIVIEQVLPANDPFLRKRREKFWINKYQSVEHGANTQG